jgi:hypothetical protein
MANWRFLNYCTEEGRNLFREWYEEQDAAVQAEIDTIIIVLRATLDWKGRKDCLPLKKRHAGLWEVRFTVNKIRYRPVGFFGPKSGEFTLLLGCSKKIRGAYTPPNAFDKALELLKSFREAGKGRVCDHD